MFSRHEIKMNLMGCVEIFLFMRRGLDRFIVSPGAAIKSFIIPIILMPIGLFVTIYASEAGAHSVWTFMHIMRMVLALGLYLVAVYFLAKQYGREGHFFKFLVIFNWMNVIGILFLLPILFGILGGYDIEAFRSYAVFITLTGYVYLAFVLTHCFRFPWEMGGFIAIVGLAIDDNLLRAMETLQSVSM